MFRSPMFRSSLLAGLCGALIAAEAPTPPAGDPAPATAAATPAAEDPAPAAEAAAVPSFTEWDAYRNAIRDAEQSDAYGQIVALIEHNGFAIGEDDDDRRWLHETLIEAHRDAGDLSAAIAALEAFVTALPEEADDHADEARRIFSAAEDIGDADHMRQALTIYESLPEGEVDDHRVVDMRLDIATAPQQLGALVAELEAKPEPTVIDLRTLAEIREEDDWPHYDPAAAAGLWQRVLDQQPDNRSAAQGVLRNRLRADEIDAAIAFYTQYATAQSVEDAERLLRDLARDLGRNDRGAEAAELITALGARLEDGFAAARMQAELFERADLVAEAETQYRTALQLAETAGDQDKIDDIADDLVDLLRDEDRYAEAITVLDGLIVEEEGEPSVRQLRWRLERAKLQERADRG